MACRITKLKPDCAYNLEGISAISLLDWDDFKGFGFAGDDLYKACKVVDIQRVGNFADVDAHAAKYTSSIQAGKLTVHTLETFISDLTAELLAALILAAKRRYVPVFTLYNSKAFTFGYEAGAVLTYSAQTEGAVGAALSLSANSIYPLFEVTPAALVTATPTIDFIPDFINGAYCEI